MQLPIYAEIVDPEVEEKLKKIDAAVKLINHEAAFIRSSPTLCVVPAPVDDRVSVGGLVVYGVSSLNAVDKASLLGFLAELTNG